MRAKQGAVVVPIEEIPQEVGIPVSEPIAVVEIPVPEVVFVGEVPTPETDKILVTEHKDGECLASSCKEDDAFGGGKEEVNGQEVVLPCTEVSEGVVQEGSA